MAKVFNEQIIDYLRNNAKQCKFNPKLYQPGETFIVKQSSGKKKKAKMYAATTENDDIPPEEAEESDGDNAPIMVEPSPEPHPDCQITEEEGATDCLPSVQESSSESDNTYCPSEDKLKGAGDARQRTDNIFADLTPSQMASLCVRCCHGCPSSPIRCILGPFPDEPVLSAVDKLLALIGVTLGKKPTLIDEFNEEKINYIPTDDSDEDEEDEGDSYY